MPIIHSCSFRVRHYECDANGHFNNANYIRLMQETALDASAAVGWDIPRYQTIQRQWLIRETEIEYFSELIYGNTVEVKTWVEDFRRVRSRRVYEFRRAGDETLTARAVTDWIFLDTQTQQPAQIPPRMILDFSPEGAPEHAPRREKFPPAPPPPPGVFHLRKRVEWRDVDAAGHLNNAAYFNMIEDISTQVARHFDWSMAKIKEAGFAIIARQQRMEYLQPALLDDEIEVATWVSDLKRVMATRHYTLNRIGDGALLARARVLWVWVDLQTMRPIRVPQHFIADFAPNIVG